MIHIDFDFWRLLRMFFIASAIIVSYDTREWSVGIKRFLFINVIGIPSLLFIGYLTGAI